MEWGGLDQIFPARIVGMILRCLLEKLPGVAGTFLIFVAAFQASGQSEVIVSWNPSVDGSTIGYRVYQGTNSGAYTSVTTVGNLTEASFGGLQSGSTYYFAVTAYDTNSLESDFSSEISLIPAASRPLPPLGASF